MVLVQENNGVMVNSTCYSRFINDMERRLQNYTGVEEGESCEEAAVREAFEEINLDIRIVRYLFARKYTHGTEYCYLAEPRNGEQYITLGYDPELDVNEQVLKQAEWILINDLKDDLQVSRVIASLTQEEIVKYKINL